MSRHIISKRWSGADFEEVNTRLAKVLRLSQENAAVAMQQFSEWEPWDLKKHF